MKSSFLGTFWIGGLTAAVVVALQKFGLLLKPEKALNRLLFGVDLPNETITLGNYLLVVVLGFAVAWTMRQIPELRRRAILLFLLLVELLAAAWVLALASVFFQPLPGVLVALLAAALVAVVHLSGSDRRRALAGLFHGRLAPREIIRLTESNLPDLTEPQTREVTFLFCEIANQAELMDELKPADCARLTTRFIELASELFLKEGAYLHGADGEGVRAIFGFPLAAANHAVIASRAALGVRDRLAILVDEASESLGKIDLRIGLAAGSVVTTLPQKTESPCAGVVLSGEPIELAHRLALANKVYGSRILLDPHAFSEAGAEIVARPIDFLRSSEAHDRLEVYELLALTADASEKEISCRDSFWKGLVYFRERRWAEAFAEFNRARRDDTETDEPLQWYLRRLEPLVLHMTTEPSAVADPLAPR
jgi:adenylate cyclase